MTSSRALANLRDLQALREHHSKAEHASALSAERKAGEEVDKAKVKFIAQNDALDHYASQDELQIERFQILAELIMQSEAELELSHEALEGAREVETKARQSLLRAEKQSDQLTELHGKARVRERRKSEDRKSLEFLSQIAATKGARL